MVGGQDPGTAGEAPGVKMTRQDVVRLIDEWQGALDRHDPVAFTKLYAENAIIESPLGGSVNGREGVQKAFEAFYKAFPDATFLSEPPRIDGDEVVIVSSIAGTHTGGFAGLPASGNPFRFQVVFLLSLRDGLIARDRRIYDFTGLMVQIGMIKAKPRDR
jgi:steroid delta-isomerase-like uncharacterized protein